MSLCIAYCGRADIDVGLIDTGFSVRPHHVVEVDALQCVIATSSEAIVVAFRGTQAPHFRQDVVFDFISPTLASGQNWLTNLETELVPFATHAGRRPGLVTKKQFWHTLTVLQLHQRGSA